MEGVQIISLIRKKQDADSLSLSLSLFLSPLTVDSLSLALDQLWTGPVMDIHNMIYNTPPWMP